LNESGVHATVAVQARQSLEETEWLLSLAAGNNWIEGVVGWVPLIDPTVEATLEKLSSSKQLRGIRHVLQAEADAYMQRPDFNAGLNLLRIYGLTYDLLVLDHQLPAAIALVDLHPNQPIVLDHLAKPRIAAHDLEPWRSSIRELARRPHVCCKLSGMVTEADLETAFESFGPARLMFGSDWPVCTVASTYRRWVDTVQEFIATLSSSEQDQIMGLNAVRFYGLPQADEQRA
jgi:L-fuconolactonase